MSVERVKPALPALAGRTMIADRWGLYTAYMDGPDDSEVLDGEVLSPDEHGRVISAPPARVPARFASVPVAQTAAVAAGSFVAGAALAGLLNHRLSSRTSRRARPRLPRGAGKGRRAGELIEIVGTRSLLVDIHLLDGSGGRR
jgi:hypothetical protein